MTKMTYEKSISLKVFIVQAETINTKAQNILWSFIDDSNLAEDSEKAPVLHFLIKRKKLCRLALAICVEHTNTKD